MKIEKNKIVFVGVILCVVLFIVSYSIIVLGSEEEPTIENNQIPVPELEDAQKEYGSKLEALDDLKEARQTNAPSIYDERLLDSTGVYDPNLLEKEKMRIVDSIYNEGHISYSDRSFRKPDVKIEPKHTQKDSIPKTNKQENAIVTKELGLEHQLFFASNPLENESSISQNTDAFIYVRVDGTQTVRNDHRLQMRLNRNAIINGTPFSKNTPVYGTVSFKPNRTLIEIESIDHRSVKLKAFDLQDGSEGIYVKNSFRAEAGQEVVGDIVDDINVVGLPHISSPLNTGVSGIKRIFQRNNRSVKVTITDNYQLILGPNKQ
ncbi:conjugative transposon protein TraM [Muricauda sp. SCSIO 64092]|uniref:conjugative transposon protein TraM n=1 Tax=Allomuricauda sp. SCSIO 64092 TaxID=2908842 RepID=UPI001FF52EEE|nr:conjugative transposon protein TraM [Muricauda sp. SCSIO 64092]UOY05758.1 conjugative transposon protein TraM [Muricauda sp. SCSIO 64092]